MFTLNERQLLEFLEERNMGHLYCKNDMQGTIEELKDKNIIKGVIYEPTFYNDTFRGVNKTTNYRTLYVIN